MLLIAAGSVAATALSPATPAVPAAPVLRSSVVARVAWSAALLVLRLTLMAPAARLRARGSEHDRQCDRSGRTPVDV